MALVVEDGTGVPGANSYVSVQYADDYFARHPFHSDAWAAVTSTTDKENLLVFATNWIDHNYQWKGYKAREENSLRWPRDFVYDADGFKVSVSSVPARLKEAVCELAFHLTKGDQEAATQTQEQGITELRIDVIELKFDKSVKLPAAPLAVGRLLKGLYEGGFGSRVSKVLVG